MFPGGVPYDRSAGLQEEQPCAGEPLLPCPLPAESRENFGLVVLPELRGVKPQHHAVDSKCETRLFHGEVRFGRRPPERAALKSRSSRRASSSATRRPSGVRR